MTRSNDERLEIFLCDYATTLLESGATTVRIEKNVCRVAESFGSHAEVNIYPRHVEVAIGDPESTESHVRTKAIRNSGINYARVSDLSRLSWLCHDAHLPLDEAVERYQKICSEERIPTWVVTILTSFANASFCRLFGGDITSMLIVGVATACGFYVKGALVKKWGLDMRLSIVMAGCISAILSCSGHVFGWGDTPDIALATSVLYLVPGIPYLNAVSDLINRHYICAVCRFLDAAVITACLSVGLQIGLLMMNMGLK